jgi:hypothetical protein
MGDDLMPFEIQPYDEEGYEAPAAADPDYRANTFMDDLRARTAVADEKQRMKWAKATKPAAQPKPLTPARPVWLNKAKPAQPAAKAASKTVPRAAGRPKHNHSK